MEVGLKFALSRLSYILATESPLKMMKNAFYFTLKALFVLKIFKFLPWLYGGHVEKRLDQKEVDFKIYDVTTWLKIITTHLLTNISIPKGNKTIKLGHLVEYDMGNIIFYKSYTKSFPDPFLKTQN